MAASKQAELNKEICRRLFEELHNQYNVGTIDERVARDVVSHEPFPGRLPGSEGIEEHDASVLDWTA